MFEEDGSEDDEHMDMLMLKMYTGQWDAGDSLETEVVGEFVNDLPNKDAPSVDGEHQGCGGSAREAGALDPTTNATATKTKRKAESKKKKRKKKKKLRKQAEKLARKRERMQAASDKSEDGKRAKLERRPAAVGKGPSRYFALDESIVCYRCGGKGHISNHCTAVFTCETCGGEHKTRECTIKKCFRCNQLGHVAQQCVGPLPGSMHATRPRAFRTTQMAAKGECVGLATESGTPYCYNCGRPGHNGEFCGEPGVHLFIPSASEIANARRFENVKKTSKYDPTRSQARAIWVAMVPAPPNASMHHRPPRANHRHHVNHNGGIHHRKANGVQHRGNPKRRNPSVSKRTSPSSSKRTINGGGGGGHGRKRPARWNQQRGNNQDHSNNHIFHRNKQRRR